MRSGATLARLAFLLVVSGGALGCGGPSEEVRAAYADLLRPAEACRAPAPPTVTPEEMRADHDVLERALRRGYGGYELAADEATWDALLRAGRAGLPDAPVSPLAFRDRLLEELAFLDDNHVGLWLYVDGRRRWRSTSGHHQAYVGDLRLRRDGDAYVDADGRRLLSCDGRPAAEVIRPIVDADALPEARFAPMLLSRERIEEVTCALRSPDGATVEAPVPLRRLDVRGPRGPSFERLDAPFPWLRLRTLFTDRADALERFVRSGVEVRDAPVVVVDLRRAGGGSDRYLLRWFRNLTDQTFAYWQTDALESEVTLQGALTFWGCVRSLSRTTDPGGRRWLDDRVARARRELDRAMDARGRFRERDPEALRLPGVAPGPFEGRLVLLVDRGCGSACETSVLLARQVPGAIVIGENTEGVMKVGELRWYQLPHSRIWVSLGHRSHRDPTATFRESFGFEPDLWLDGDDPAGDVRALAACLADPTCGDAIRPR